MGRKYARYVSPEICSASGPIVFPCRRTACTRSFRPSIAAMHGPRRGPHRRRGESRLRRLGRLRRVGEEHDLRVQQPLEARRHLVVDLERRGNHARQPRASLEDRHRDDLVQLPAREPGSLGLRALERARDRGHVREIRRVGEGPVGAREGHAPRVRRDHEVRAGARGLLALQGVEDRRGVGLARLGHERRHHRDRAGVVDDHGQRAVQLVVAVLLEGLPAGTGLLQVLVDLGVGHLARAIGRDGDGAAHGDEDQQRHRQENLERQREPGRLGRRKLQPLRPDLARGRAGARRRRMRVSNAHPRRPGAACSPFRTCSCAAPV